MSVQDTLAIIEKEKILGIIRTGTAEEAYQSAIAAIQGGLKLVEVAMTIPEVYTVIGELVKNPNIMVVAGTVLNADMAELAIESGARWIISPHTDPEIISFCKYHHICVSAGALSPNEIYTAWNLGSDIVKVYPIHSVGGASYIRSLKGPLPFVKLIPTGSILIDNALEYLEAGAVSVGIGASIFDKESIQTRQYHRITERVQKLIALLHAWYKTK